ncbi:unnamed protein product [Closterium sp. NIES-54]
MVGAVGDAGVVDTLEARLEDVRRRHEANEYVPNLLLAVIEAGIRSVWVEEHPARPTSPRSVNNEGSIDVGVNAVVTKSATMWEARRRIEFTPDRISVTPLLVGRPDILTWKEAIEPQLEMAGLIGFARGTVATPEEHNPDLRAEFRAVQLLTFTVISRCCSPGVLATVVAVAGSRPRTPTRRSQPRIAAVEEEVDVESAGCAATPTTSRGRNQPRKEKQSTKSSTSAKDADSSAGGKGRDDKEASCSLVGVVEPTVSLAPEAGEEFQAMAAAVQANPAVVLLDSGCSHHLMGTKEVFADLQPSGDVKHVRGFNGALQDVRGRGTVALQGEAGGQVLIPDVLYVPGVRANLLSAGQLKENGVKLQEDGVGMLLVSAAGDVLGRASYTGRVLCTDLRPCSAKSTTPSSEVVALRAIISMTKSMPDRLHARLAHVGMNTIRSLAKHEVTTGLDLKSASGIRIVGETRLRKNRSQGECREKSREGNDGIRS